MEQEEREQEKEEVKQLETAEEMTEDKQLPLAEDEEEPLDGEQLTEDEDLQVEQLPEWKENDMLQLHKEDEDEVKKEDLELEKEKVKDLQLQEVNDEIIQLQEDKEGNLQLPKEEEEEEKEDVLQLQEEDKVADLRLQEDEEKELPKEVEVKEDDKLQLQEDEKEDNLELSKEVEVKQDDHLQLQEEVKEDNLQLSNEGEVKEDDDSQLQEEEKEDNLELPKEKEENLELQEEVEVKEDDNLQLQEEGKEENTELQEGKEENAELQEEEEEGEGEEDLEDKEDEEKDDAAGAIEENGEDKDFDNSAEPDAMKIDESEKIQELNDDSHLAADADTDTGGVDGSEDTGGEGAGGDANMEDVEVEDDDNVGDNVSKGKRKRGKIQGKMKPTPQRRKKDEEDVCFICYDGGSLVLCDRRGCPKAYHLACIKRDESFFQSKAKWNCDWHICSSCQKASHYMCYTCAYSLCKGCTKDADYVCVRGNKGFCGACLRTIMLIENITPGNTETAPVDFDDKTSWEYLFKDYWMDLKAKLSLTIEELTKAKSPWKGNEVHKAKNSGKGTSNIVTPKESSSGEHYQVDEEKDPSLENSGNVEGSRSKRRKTRDQGKVLKKQNSIIMEDSDTDEVTPLTKGTAWATKVLLEFVAHMKNGDTSVVSQFDVQALLVEYIKRNNLRDPRQKSQIICDSRLRNLFGQSRVGHFEMLKLLENHFLIKEKSPADDSVRTGVSDAADSDTEAAGSSDSRNDKRRKARKKSDGRRSRINPNSEEYAAIDVHNINLLYLKRNLLENLLDDTEKFHEMVVGSFVRIRISGGDQKQNMYRLVPIIGTSKVDESYKVGSRTTDFMLEILNLNKKEVVSIDGISNQEFLEDECRRLRQSIKCGLIKHLKVGEVQEKAMALQTVKVNDWLQAEVARLNHLRDRASETGRRKELRECVEKLDLLKSPKERQRRLHEIPDVHVDPNMDPSYESEEDAGEADEIKQGDHLRPRNIGFGRKLLERNSSFREGDKNDMGNRVQKNSANAFDQSRNIGTHYVDRESRWSQGGGVYGLNNQNASKNQLSPTGTVTSDWSSRAAVRSESHPGTVTGDWNSRAAVRSESHPGTVTGDWSSRAAVRSESHPGVASAAIPSPLSSGREPSFSDFETQKMWHYRDPSGNVQGPFSITQLRKWSAKGHFPPHFRVWRTNEKQDDSILLTDVLDGRVLRM